MSCLQFNDDGVLSTIWEGCRRWSPRTILINTTLMWKQLPRSDDWLGLKGKNPWEREQNPWKNPFAHKKTQESVVKCWREGANLEDERWQSNKMDGIEWVIQLVQPWTLKANSRSVIFVYSTLGWVVYQIQGSQHGPTTQSLPILSEFFFGMRGFPFQLASIHSLLVPFWTLGFNWNTLKFICFYFFFFLYAYVNLQPQLLVLWSHLTIIWYKNDLGRLLALKITVQAWELLIMPWTVLKQHEFGKGMRWLGSVPSI